MVKLTVYEGVSPILDQLALINREAALDALDYSGTKLRNAIRESFKAKVTDWEQYIVNGKRRWRKNTVSLGRRFNLVKVGPDSMESFIQSYLMESKLTEVVAGRFKAPSEVWAYRDGKKSHLIKGPDSVGKGSFALLQKLNYGDAREDGYQKYVQRKGNRMGNYPARNFVEEGRAIAMPSVIEGMTTRLENQIGKQLNEVSAKSVEMKRVSK